MKLFAALKALPLTMLVTASLGLSPSLALADNSERGYYKSHKSSETRKHQKNRHDNADKPRHIKKQLKREARHGYYKPSESYLHNKHHRKHHRKSKKHHKHGYGHQHNTHRPHRHHDGHVYYKHHHGGKHYNHRHSSHSLADYLSNEQSRRYYLNLSNQKFLFGLHTGNLDIIYGH